MSDFRSASPSSDIFTDGYAESLSLRDKSLLKRSISKHDNNNCKAGYVPVHQQYLNNTGIRGRKTFGFWILVFLLFVLALGNLILTFIILGVLRLSQGMQSLELVSEEMAVKFFGNADLGDVYKRDGKLEGYFDVPVEILGDNGSIYVNVAMQYGRSNNKFKLDSIETIFRNLEYFEIKNKRSNLVFSTNTSDYKKFKNLKGIKTKLVESKRITSSINDNLSLEGRIVNLKGPEGARMESQEITFAADQNVNILSNDSIHIYAKEGISISTRNLFINEAKHNDYINPQFKVCICLPQGKLFKIRMLNYHTKVHCNQVTRNPCI